MGVDKIETAFQVVGVDGRRERKNDHPLQVYFIKGCLFVSCLIVTGLAKPKIVGHLRTENQTWRSGIGNSAMQGKELSVC